MINHVMHHSSGQVKSSHFSDKTCMICQILKYFGEKHLHISRPSCSGFRIWLLLLLTFSTLKIVL